MKNKKTRTYLGYTILPCSYQSSRKAGYRWYLESIHLQSGIPWGEDCSHRFRSLREVREYLRDSRLSR